MISFCVCVDCLPCCLPSACAFLPLASARLLGRYQCTFSCLPTWKLVHWRGQDGMTCYGTYSRYDMLGHVGHVLGLSWAYVGSFDVLSGLSWRFLEGKNLAQRLKAECLCGSSMGDLLALCRVRGGSWHYVGQCSGSMLGLCSLIWCARERQLPEPSPYMEACFGHSGTFHPGPWVQGPSCSYGCCELAIRFGTPIQGPILFSSHPPSTHFFHDGVGWEACHLEDTAAIFLNSLHTGTHNLHWNNLGVSWNGGTSKMDGI